IRLTRAVTSVGVGVFTMTLPTCWMGAGRIVEADGTSRCSSCSTARLARGNERCVLGSRKRCTREIQYGRGRMGELLFGGSEVAVGWGFEADVPLSALLFGRRGEL